MRCIVLKCSLHLCDSVVQNVANIVIFRGLLGTLWHIGSQGFILKIDAFMVV